MGIGYAPEGGEFQVNTTTLGYQAGSSVTVFDDGSFIVVWASQSGDGSGYGVYTQRYDSDGNAVGPETRINTTTAGDQNAPSISSLEGGGYVVTWTSANQDGSGTGIYSQRYDSFGVAQGVETRVNTTTASTQSSSAVTALGDGGYVVVWQSLNQDGNSYGIYSQRYDASGAAQGTETRVNTTVSGAQMDPAVASLNDGGYVITWTSKDATTGEADIYLQRYNSAGVAQGSETFVTSTPNLWDQTHASVAVLEGGGFVVTWQADNADGSEIYARLYDSAGVPQGAETLVNTTTAGAQEYPYVTALAGGGYVIVWQSPDANSTGVYGQAYDAAGNPAGVETQINVTTDGPQLVSGGSLMHAVAARPDGGFVVTWASNQDGSLSGVEARIFTTTTLNYTPAGADHLVTLDEDTSHAILAADFGFTDADGNAFAGAVITTVPTNGTLTLDGAAVIAGQFVSAADISAGHLVFAPDANEHGSGYASFTFQVRDDGGTANGGVDTDQTPNTITFDVTSIPDGASQLLHTVGDVLTISDGISDFANNQYGVTYPEMIKLADGNVVVVGTGAGQLVGRILSPDGQPVTDDIVLVANNGSHWDTLAITALHDGGFALVYDGEAGHVMLGHYDSSGNVVGAPVEVTTTGASGPVSTTTLDNGNVVVGYLTSTGYFAQIFDDAGAQVAHFAITTSGGGWADIAATPDGGFYAVWVDGQALVGRQFASDGTPESAAITIQQSAVGGGEMDPSVAVLADGTVAVATRYGGVAHVGGVDTVALTINVVLIHPDGTKDLPITVTPITETTQGNSDINEERPSIVALPDGGFAVGFVSDDNYGGYGAWNYYVATFDADGNRLTGNLLVNSSEGSASAFGDLVALSDGSVLAAWGQGDGTHGRLLTPGDLAGPYVHGDDGANVLSGTALGEVIDGAGGDDTLDGGAGADVLRGGTGNDSYIVDNSLDSVVETSSTGGDDSVTASASFRLGEGMFVEHLIAAPGTASIDLTGNKLDQSLTGNAGDNVLDGGGGNDTFAGGAGDDTYVILGDRTNGAIRAANLVVENANEGTDTVIVTFGSYTLTANVENLTGTESIAQSLTGNELDNVITGGSGDALFGLAGNDTLVRSSGYGTMAGGSGDDLYILFNGSEQITENAGEGVDEVRIADGSHTLAANVENLTGLSSTGQELTGNTLDNRILAGSGNDNIQGQDGNDFVDAGAGNDSVSGGAGADILYGAQGNDTLSGGEGADTFVFKAGGGTDTIADLAVGDQIDIGGYTSAVSISQVGANVVVTLSGTDSITVQNSTVAAVQSALHFGTFGGSGDDSLNGGSGRDFIDGFIGNDTISGLAGDDSIRGGDGNDILNGGGGNDILDGGAGIDTASYATAGSGVTVSLAVTAAQNTGGAGTDTLTNIENLIGSANGDTLTGNGSANILSGGGGADRLMGAAGNDVLDGGIGNDVLDGGIGADTMAGGAGSDTYWVDNAGDTVSENGNEGVDTVHAGLSWTLGDNVENLVLAGTAAIDGTGNGLANSITGNAGDNHLSGLDGNDVLSGLGGSDTLDGGVGADQLSGGAGNDSLSGGDGNDTLDGGSGNDTMTGGVGNDIYVVDTASDTISENAGEGIDTVRSSTGWTLGANLENLTLTGSGNIDGTGNELNNTVLGNSGVNLLTGLGGNDTLKGGAGNDTLDGGAGRDTLNGGTGADQFVFHGGDTGATGATADVIYGFSSAEGDKVNLQAVDANSLLGGDQAFSFIGTDTFHHVAGELRYQESGGNTFVYADLDGDGHADLAIMLGGTHALTSGDFVL